MTFSVDEMRTVDFYLRARKQVLVEVSGGRTQWCRPALISRYPEGSLRDDRLPQRGYVLASRARMLGDIEQTSENRAYVTDVNSDHRWREVFMYFDTLSDAIQHVLG